MTPGATDAAARHRAALEDLDMVAQARAAADAADAHLTAILRIVLDRRDVTGLTAEQIGQAAELSRRAVYARVPQTEP